MIFYETNVLAHHGILGMKWGVRRYQNKDGSLTSEGKRHLKTANAYKEKREAVNKEMDSLMKKNKKLSKDFGGSSKNVDDTELFEFTAYGDYGLDTKKLNSLRVDEYEFYQKNKKSIAIGEKIVKKLGYK